MKTVGMNRLVRRAFLMLLIGTLVTLLSGCPAPSTGSDNSGSGAGTISFEVDGVPKSFTYGEGLDNGAFGFRHESSSIDEEEEIITEIGYLIVGYENLDDVSAGSNYVFIAITEDIGGYLVDVILYGSSMQQIGHFDLGTWTGDDLAQHVDFGTEGGRITGSFSGSWQFSGEFGTVTLSNISFDVERIPDVVE